jgi:Mg2+-importing ATPase
VDSAVDIAKESADIILLEKSLAVLGVASESRSAFNGLTERPTSSPRIVWRAW